MAALGHLAVGLAIGQGASRFHPAYRRIRVVALAVWLATLPDLDSYLGFVGVEHRGPTHSIAFLLACAVLAALIARAASWHVGATVLLALVAVGSHLLVDMLGPGRPIQLLWPMSSTPLQPLNVLAAPEWISEFRWELLWASPFVLVGVWPVVRTTIRHLRR